jgi:hypothetical protein
LVPFWLACVTRLASYPPEGLRERPGRDIPHVTQGPAARPLRPLGMGAHIIETMAKVLTSLPVGERVGIAFSG